MKRRVFLYLLIPFASLIGAIFFRLPRGRVLPKVIATIDLPEPRYESDVSIERAISSRRSRRRYGRGSLTLEQVSQLLWAAQGITERRRGFRAAPSAGATYPLEVYIVVKNGGVEGIDAGIYHYRPRGHRIELIREGDYTIELMDACLGQEWVGAAQMNIVISAIYERTTRWYGERGRRYVHMEVGHVGQNLYLQCESLGLSTVVIGAFYDDDVKRIVGMRDEEAPLYVLPIGRRV